MLHLSDTHLGVTRRTRGAPAGYRRDHDHLAAMRAALAPALGGEVDLVVHSGDVFNRSRPPRSVVRAAAELLARVAAVVPVIVVAGNHDRRGVARHLAGGAIRDVVDDAARVVVDGVALALVAYKSRVEDFRLAAARACRGGADLLVCHQAFDGSRVGRFRFTAGREPDTVGAEDLPPGVRWVAAGHLHPRQRLAVGEATVVHVGSTERTSFTERAETKGYALWDLASRVTCRFVDLPSRPMAVVTTPEDLDAVEPGTLVLARGVDLDREALRRGGWAVGPPPALLGRAARPEAPPSPQLALFPHAPRRRGARSVR